MLNVYVPVGTCTVLYSDTRCQFFNTMIKDCVYTHYNTVQDINVCIDFLVRISGEFC